MIFYYYFEKNLILSLLIIIFKFFEYKIFNIIVKNKIIK